MMALNFYFSILLCMIFMHIIDDFVLQPICLSKLKQKETWEEYCEKNDKPFNLYQNDYKVALLIHSLSWSIAIIIPWLLIASNLIGRLAVITVIVNTLIHFMVDDLKANHYKINLATDQITHFIQILLTWIFLVVAI